MKRAGAPRVSPKWWQSSRRDVGQRINECYASVRAEQKERLAAVEELSECLLRHRSSSREASTEAREFREAVEKDRAARSELEQHLRGILLAEQRERAAMDAELAASLKDTRAVLEGEVKARERGDLALTRNVAAAREALEEVLRQQEVLDDKLQQGIARFATLDVDEKQGPLDGFVQRARSECLEEFQTDLDTLRDGIAKVVEAVQQERRSRTESDGKLLEDCQEAVQKEASIRFESESKLRKDLEAEAHLRQEAVEIIQQAIEECRTSLETHTHDFQSPGR